MNVTWSPGLLEEQTQALAASVGDSLGHDVGGRLLRREASRLDVTCQVVAGVFLLVRSEEALMQTVLGEEFRPWLDRFLPGLGEGAHAHLLEPPSVLDTTDGQGAHLLGLSLSRAWQLRTLARSLGGRRADILHRSADA